MTTREEALEQLFRVVDEADLSNRECWHGVLEVKDRLSSFNDETLVRLAQSFKDEEIGETVVYRTIMLLSSLQRKNLEPVVRNIMIFAPVAKRFMDEMNIPARKQWKVFAPVEKYARTKVCGMHNALETPKQENQMLAVFHGHFALVQNFIKDHNLTGYDRYASKDVTQMVLFGPDRNKNAEILDVFLRHPEETERLSKFIVAHGGVDPKLLESVAFFGDDELPTSIMSGVL